MNRLIKSLAAVALLASTPLAAQTAPADPLIARGHWTANTRGNAATPPMGWNSWNAFRTLINEERLMDTARTLVDTGLANLGYRYVNIDDGWWLKRRQSDRRMLIRTNIFPSTAVKGPRHSSFRPITDKLHAMGLKAGIYSDIGYNSCSQAYDPKSPNLPQGTRAERQIGLRDNMERDIDLYFREWGFDYIKVDACGLHAFRPGTPPVAERDFGVLGPFIDKASLNRTDIAGVRAMYAKLGEVLARSNPDNDYVYSICLWGDANVREWGKNFGNAVRTSDDILPKWTRMLYTFDTAAQRPLYAQPGSWNDPDMLEIGNGEFDSNHLTEARTHFSLWAMVNAPLLIGFDLKKLTPELLAILKNEELIRAHQDPSGHQAVLAYASEDVQTLVKSTSDPKHKLVALFNRGNGTHDVTLLAEHLKFAGGAPITLRDLWSKERLAPFTGERKFTIKPRETLVFEAVGTRVIPNGLYVSEVPGMVNVAHDGVVRPEPDPMPHLGISPWNGTRDSPRPMLGGRGSAQADQTALGEAIQLAGKGYRNGIGVLANSRLELKTDGKFRRFAAEVGVDDNSRQVDVPVTFQVYGDGKLLAESDPMKFGDKAHQLGVSIAGVKIVELVVRQTGERKLPASVAWADAALLYE
jgi:hypothetical protein